MSTTFDFSKSQLALPKSKVEEYVTSLKSKAETLIFSKFPEKILELNSIIEASNFNSGYLKDIHQDLNTPAPKPLVKNVRNKRPAKKCKYDTNARLLKTEKIESPTMSSIPINKHILALMSDIKPRIKGLIEDLDLLKMWVSLMIPKIEDGNNFGVSVQAAVLAVIRLFETSTSEFFEEISKYYVSRGKLISSLRKYPHVEDYKQAVEELDEKEYLNICLMMMDIRNYYASLHDVVTKNYDKITKPRSANACESLY